MYAPVYVLKPNTLRAALLQYHLLLLPDHIPTTPKRPLWDYIGRPQGDAPVRAINSFDPVNERVDPIGYRSCLHSNPAFGKLAISLFLEKLNTGSPATKVFVCRTHAFSSLIIQSTLLQKDTLDTLDVCLPVYGAAVAREFARKLWNALKLEVGCLYAPILIYVASSAFLDLPTN